MQFNLKVPRKLFLIVLAVALFLPLFLMRSSQGNLDLSEIAACIGVFLLYLLNKNLISRFPLTGILVLIVLLSGAVLALAYFVSPHPESLTGEPGETGAYPDGESEVSPDVIIDSLANSASSQVVRSIDSLASSGGEVIRNVGLFSGEGTVGRTLGAVGEVTSATAEILIRTIYFGSNVALVDTTSSSGDVPDKPVDPLRLFALLLAVAVSIAILTCLRYLVLVERRKGTLAWFRLLIIVLLLRVLYVSFGLEQLVQQAVSDFENAEVLLSVNPFYVLLLILAVVNGFRTKWIHYLNRWRKYIALLGAVGVLFLSQSVLLMYFSGGLTQMSFALGSLVGCVFTILFIFSAIAALSILFLLPSARLVDRKFDQLRILDGLGQSIFSTFNEEKIISASTALGRKLSRADECWAMAYSDLTGEMWRSDKQAAGKWIFPEEWHLELKQQLEKSGGTLLLNRYPSSSLTRFSDVASPCPGSLLAALLRVRKQSIGVLCAVTSRQFGFMSESKTLFGTFARQTAAAVQNARLMEMELERERYKEELAIARSIQESLLPGDLPTIPGFAVEGLSIQSRQVGGDYYDVFHLPGNLYGIAIADVSGKGAAAALLMAALQAALHAVAPAMLKDAGGVVERLNHLMSERMPDDKFITFFYGVLDPLAGTISYCCAGHDPPVLIKNSGDVEKLDQGGLIIGVIEEARYSTATAVIDSNDTLLLYTDGVTESMKAGEDIEFGSDRLIAFALKHSKDDPSTMIGNLVEVLDRYRDNAPANDDLTLLVIASLGLTH